MLQDVSQAVICPGNPDEEFISLCKTRGSIMKGNRGSTETVAFNVRNPLLAQMKRKDSIAPYTSPNDERFKVQQRAYLDST